jgi:hypothetical protein
MALIHDKAIDSPPALKEQLVLVRCETATTDWTVPSTNVRYRVLAWLTVAAGLAYLCRSAVGVAESGIRQELGLTLEQDCLRNALELELH